MSRHRFVRDLDLDAEMEDDSGEEEGQVQGGMTAEEKAQMATSMPIAKALLQDVKPPIADDAIADSLWHYWFDVDKAVTYLRKDWEKKDEPPPSNLLPTPDQQRRRRSAKSPRTTREASPQPPLTALQRLSSARKQARSAPPTASMTNTASGSSSHTGTPADPVSKPVSKLALLAQKRKEAARARETLPSGADTPPESSIAAAVLPDQAKPLSKLAQKTAAAKVRSVASTRETSGAVETTGSGNNITEDANASPDQIDEISSALFSAHISNGLNLPAPKLSNRPSPFFSIVTSSSPITTDSEGDPPLTNMHLPLVRDPAELERRIREAFGPDVESPDDIVLRARQGRAVAKTSGPSTPKSASLPGKPRTTPASGSKLQARTQPNTPNSNGKAGSKASGSGTSTPGMSGAQQDMAGLHLEDEADEIEKERERERFREKPVSSMKQEELIAKVKRDEAESGQQNISLIVVGHVDAGKSTLMGRLLYELGELSEKERTANERGSKRVGKGSFAFAWGLDALGDERDRGVTIDIATTHFATPRRNITLLDAPGHRDFIPAMISGAAQADVALMVVDGSPGEFEAGFERGGQTREHAWLVRSLGVKQIIVGINKMDLVSWSQDRYEDIVDALKPFLVSAGFASSKTTFLPIAAMDGVNILSSEEPTLSAWYEGTTLIEALDKVEVPHRPYDRPLRIPVSNLFKGQTAIASGVAVSGRLCSGVIQVGDRIRAVPGDEVANVRTIEVDEDSASYAVAGQNVTLYLSGIDSIHLAIGTVLCPTGKPVRLVTHFVAQILVFDVQSPIITGTAVELFHHSMNVPANISKLVSISEKGAVVKKNPRVLQKGVTATVVLTLRSSPGSTGRAPTIPLETAADNKEMGRVLIRRGGETIAAGVVTEILV